MLEDPRFSYDESLHDLFQLPIGVNENDSFEIDNENLNEEEKKFFHEKINLNAQESKVVEKKTINQNNSLWHGERKIRLTASNFHRVVSRKGNFHELSVKLLQSPDLSHIPAVKYGKESEEKVKRHLIEEFPQHKFRNVGFVINPKFPFLGASPDGLLFNNEEQLLVEIKSVYNVEQVSLDELLKRPNFCLKKDVPYVLSSNTGTIGCY